MDSVVFGQYIKGNSWLHKMDSRIKIISIVLLIVTLFLFKSIYSVLAFLLFLVIVILTTRIPFKKIINGLKPLIFLLIFTFIVQSIYTKEGQVFELEFSLSILNISLMVVLTIVIFLLRKFNYLKGTLLFVWFISLFLIQYFLKNDSLTNYKLIFYEGGIIKACFIFLRLVGIVTLSSLLTFTTMPMDLNNAIEALLKPFKVVKLPVSEISMMISITLRFIPTLLEETNKIMRAQAARGVDFKDGNIKKKVTQMISLLVPMFVISFKRAEDLAYAMETRGYQVGAKRTKYDELKMKFMDYFTLFFVISLLLGVVIYWFIK